MSCCKHESILEELKDTNERIKSLELLNVQLTGDNKVLRKKLDQVNEEKYVATLKISECEKFIHRLSKEYENRNSELKTSKQNETSLMAELIKERNERKNIAIQRDKDALVIQDLQRQVKEMEMILKRKHPDSVSALIGTIFTVHCIYLCVNLLQKNCWYLFVNVCISCHFSFNFEFDFNLLCT